MWKRWKASARPSGSLSLGPGSGRRSPVRIFKQTDRSDVTDQILPVGAGGGQQACRRYHYLESSSLEPLLRTLVEIRVSQINGCVYCVRVKLAAGGRIPPHTHPDGRNSTVLQGVLYVGFGRTFDESKVVAIPTGAICVIPADVPHHVWAKDGDVVYQEAGVGITRTIFIDEAASPR